MIADAADACVRLACTMPILDASCPMTATSASTDADAILAGLNPAQRAAAEHKSAAAAMMVR